MGDASGFYDILLWVPLAPIQYWPTGGPVALQFHGLAFKGSKMLFGSVPFWPAPISAVVRGNDRGENVFATDGLYYCIFIMNE